MSLFCQIFMKKKPLTDKLKKKLIAEHKAWARRTKKYIEREARETYPELDLETAKKRFLEEQAGINYADYLEYWAALTFKEQMERLKSLMLKRHPLHPSLSREARELGAQMTIQPYKNTANPIQVKAVFSGGNSDEVDEALSVTLASFGFFQE